MKINKYHDDVGRNNVSGIGRTSKLTPGVPESPSRGFELFLEWSLTLSWENFFCFPLSSERWMQDFFLGKDGPFLPRGLIP